MTITTRDWNRQGDTAPTVVGAPDPTPPPLELVVCDVVPANDSATHYLVSGWLAGAEHVRLKLNVVKDQARPLLARLIEVRGPVAWTISSSALVASVAYDAIALAAVEIASRRDSAGEGASTT